MVISGAEDGTGAGGISSNMEAALPPAGEAVKEGELDVQSDQEARPPSPLRSSAPAPPRVVGWLFNPEGSVFSSRLKDSDAKVWMNVRPV